jgi:excisionase family DNA binding protein
VGSSKKGGLVLKQPFTPLDATNCSIPEAKPIGDIQPLGSAEPLLGKKEIAKHLAVCERTLCHYVARKIIPAIKFPGGAIRFRQSEVEEALNRYRTAVCCNEEGGVK